MMQERAIQFPGYGWETNVGYATPEHRKGIKKLGITLMSTKSFRINAHLVVRFK